MSEAEPRDSSKRNIAHDHRPKARGSEGAAHAARQSALVSAGHQFAEPEVRGDKPVPPLSEGSAGSVDRVSTLLHEYDALRDETLVQLGFYKAHVRNFQILIGAVLVVAGFALANSGARPSSTQGAQLIQVASNWQLWLGIAAAIPVATSYMVLDVAESLYSVGVISSHLAVVEGEINNAVRGDPLLTWESSVSPRFWKGVRPAPRVLNPNWLLGTVQSLLFVGINVGLPVWILGQLLDANARLQSAALPIAVTVVGCFTVALTLVVAFVTFWVAVKNRPRLIPVLTLDRDMRRARAT